MENLNFINFIYIVDLSLLSLIEYLDSVEHDLTISDDNKIYLSFSKHQKDILTSFIIEHTLHAYQYSKKNIIYNTCKPMLNWRQSERKNGAIRSYKYKLLDNSIYIDLIKLNQYVDYIFNKLKTINLNNLKYNGILKSFEIGKFSSYKSNIAFCTLENIDSFDLCGLIKTIMTNIAECSFISSTCNIIQDGNNEYIHSALNNINLLEIVKQKLIDIGVL